MSELKITGTINYIGEVETGTAKNGNEWAKITFAVATGGEYPKDVAFTVFGADKVDKFKQFNKIGQVVDVKFEPTSRWYNGRYYTDLQAWSIFANKAENVAPENIEVVVEEDDDLPF